MPNQTTIVVRLGFVYFVSDKQNQINPEKKPYLVFIHYMNYLKASISRKQISRFSFEPKDERKYFCISDLAYKKRSNQKSSLRESK